MEHMLAWHGEKLQKREFKEQLKQNAIEEARPSTRDRHEVGTRNGSAHHHWAASLALWSSH